jgi:hypothetical protein
MFLDCIGFFLTLNGLKPTFFHTLSDALNSPRNAAKRRRFGR